MLLQIGKANQLFFSHTQWYSTLEESPFHACSQIVCDRLFRLDSSVKLEDRLGSSVFRSKTELQENIEFL